ncbi:Threonine-phosphate decarboxylase [Sinobacterium norvegicum]|uniref:threonine-phosphate decarboxylase n=1 Tax=Sinobacterium norvegicum TaxID=1641715 RepID=A0ABN8EKL2_9GAMM|nr:threonine-phosphate decarboxylase CobD [Sinobacterium norvegicum]CAH0991917.1 Threonine-phosphate decarboxylase [Sinobacterium norvegicum]
MKKLNHGGNIRYWAEKTKTATAQWLDLSTGVSPDGYPVEGIPAAAFQYLPDRSESLMRAAREYYQSHNIVAVNGSQQAIEMLPRLIAPLRVALPDVGYQEHAHCWQRAGHTAIWYDGFNPEQLQALIDMEKIDAAVLINPNNPTGARVGIELIASWAAAFARRGGVLIVDEAFIDLTPEQSVSGLTGRPGLVVLRSVGKFFGLAGLRVGFVMAESSLLSRIEAELSPWQINGPAEFLLIKALADSSWQHQQRNRTQASSMAMAGILQLHLPHVFCNNGLFLTAVIANAEAEALFAHLLNRQILIRIGAVDKQRSFVRFGLIENAAVETFAALEQALSDFMTPRSCSEAVCEIAN